MQSTLSLLSLLPLVLSAPAPNPQGAFGGGPSSDPVCADAQRYSITSQSGPHNGPPRLVAGEECEANIAGCTISDGKTYGVTITISEGFNLGLNLYV